MKEDSQPGLRSVILWSLVVTLAIAMAPWFSGGQEPVAMLLTGAALLLGGLLCWMQPAVRRLPRGPLVVTYALLLIWALFSLTWSANRYSSVIWLAEWTSAALAFWASYVIAGEERGVTRMINAYLVSAGIFCVVAIWMFFATTYSRLTGTIYWPNPAAAYLLPAAILSMDRLRKAEDSRVWRWASVLAFFLCSFFLANSRAALIVFIMIAAIYLLVVKETKRFWTYLLFSSLVAGALSFGFGKVAVITSHHNVAINPGSRFASAVQGQDSSLADRLLYLESAGRIWLAHPIFGTGAGTYGDVHPRYQQTVVSASADAHDVYVQIMAELGIVGGLLVAGSLVWLMWGTLRGLVAAPERAAIALSGVALLLHFGMDIDAQYPALLMLAAVLFGLVWHGAQEKRKKLSVAWPALSLAILIPVASLYVSDIHASRGQAAQDRGDLLTAAAEYQQAHAGIVYNPVDLTAEGINLYAIATMGGSSAARSEQLALGLAREAERQAPYDGQHHQLEGRVLALQGRYAAAETAFRVALKLDPLNHPGYALDLATVELRAGNASGAEATAKSMLALYPQKVLNQRLADSTLRPMLADLDSLVGNIELGRGHYGVAEAYAKVSLKLNPGNIRGLALQRQAARHLSN